MLWHTYIPRALENRERWKEKIERKCDLYQDATTEAEAQLPFTVYKYKLLLFQMAIFYTYETTMTTTTTIVMRLWLRPCILLCSHHYICGSLTTANTQQTLHTHTSHTHIVAHLWTDFPSQDDGEHGGIDYYVTPPPPTSAPRLYCENFEVKSGLPLLYWYFLLSYLMCSFAIRNIGVRCAYNTFHLLPPIFILCAFFPIQ